MERIALKSFNGKFIIESRNKGKEKGKEQEKEI